MYCSVVTAKTAGKGEYSYVVVKPGDRLANEWEDHRQQGTQMELNLLHDCLVKHLSGAPTEFGRMMQTEAKGVHTNVFLVAADLRNVVEHGLAGSNSMCDVKKNQPPITMAQVAEQTVVEVKKILKALGVSKETAKMAKSLEDRLRTVLLQLSKGCDRIDVDMVLHAGDQAPSELARIAINRNQQARMKGRGDELSRVVLLLRQQDARVLVHGESGCGKSMLADAALLTLVKQPEDSRLQNLSQLNYYRVRASTEAGFISCHLPTLYYSFISASYL
jgi:ATP-dependent Clp protease ATP-binding subunit ClpA